MKRRTACLAAALLLAMTLGCRAAQEEESGGLELWFPTQPTQEGRQLAAALGTCPYEGADRSVSGLLSALLAGPSSEAAELDAIFPRGTRVLSWSLEDRVLSVELSAAYAQLVGIDLTLADYCVTLTLTQLDGVDGVRITASGGGQSFRERRVLYPQDVLFSGEAESPQGRLINY